MATSNPVLLAALQRKRKPRPEELTDVADAQSADNTATLDKVANVQFPEVDELAPPPPKPLAPRPVAVPNSPTPQAPVQDWTAPQPTTDVSQTPPDVAPQNPLAPDDSPDVAGPRSVVTPDAVTPRAGPRQPLQAPREMLRTALGRKYGQPTPSTTPQPSTAPLTDEQQLSQADDVDRRNTLIRGLELAGKQFNAGVSRTPVAELTPQMPSQRAALMQALQAKRQAEADKMKAGIEGREMGLRQTEADLRAKALAQAEEKAKGEAAAKAKAEALAAERLAEEKRHNRAGEGADWTRAKAAEKAAEAKTAPVEFDEDGNPIGGPVAERRFALVKKKYDTSVEAPAEWLTRHPEDKGKTFATPDDGSKFRQAVTLNAQAHGHLDDMIEDYRAMRAAAASGDMNTAAGYRGKFNVEMEALIPKLTGAEGMSGTVSSLENIKKSLEGDGWIDSVSKSANAEYLPSLLSTAKRNIDKNLDSMGRVMLEHRGGGKPKVESTTPDEDAAAIAWAKANPKDPRAAAILEHARK